MIVTPKGAAAPSAPSPGESARDRAMAKLLGPQQAEPSPVQNQSQVSPEEFSAVIAKKKQEDAPEASADPVQEGQEESEPAEAAPEETKAPEAKDPLSSQYAVLARKEKALRAQVQKFNAEREAFKAEQAQKAAATPAFDESKYIPREKLANKDWNTLSELGFTYDDLTNLALNPPQQQDPRTAAMIEELKAEIKALKGETENTKKSFEEQQTQSYKQAVNQIRNEAKNLVNSSDAFETIKETGSHEEVVKLIEETFKADGVLLSVEEAAQAVEDHLVEEATRLAKLKKVQAKLQPPQAAKPVESAAKPAAGQPAAKTLTNAIGTSRKLSARERALLAFEGKLQKS